MTTYFFSPSTKAFYLAEIHGEAMPKDVLPINEQKHAELMEADNNGYVIGADAEGNPISVKASNETTWEKVRENRNMLLDSSDWTQLPDVTISEEQLIEWRTYRQKLRDIAIGQGTPESVVWPTAP